MKTHKIIIGTDNGVSGAMVCMVDGKPTAKLPMPLQKTRKGNEVDASEVWRYIKAWTWIPDAEVDVVVVIEEPGGSKSAKAATSMAGAFHAVRAVVEVMGLRLVRITPAQWQKPFLKCKTGDTKPVARQMAKSLYPSFDCRPTERCTVPDSGIVDALLICSWAHRNNI